MLLRYRRARRELFEQGTYQPLAADGLRRDHLFGFSRIHGDERILVVVPRLPATLLPDPEATPLGERVWGDTAVRLPEGSPQPYRNVLTGRCVSPVNQGDGVALLAAEIFEDFPIALLESR
jgi:(1->4)-alpha-D-glucan 1-alpha-D-glucosylmutase